MTPSPRLRYLLRAARVRVLLRVLAFALPAGLALAAFSWRMDEGALPYAAALAIAVAAFAAWRAVRRIDRHWLSRQLDARDPRMEDSASLLFAEPAALAPLQRLQRERLRSRLDAAPPPDLRPEWPSRALAGVAVPAMLVMLASLAWPPAPPAPDVPQRALRPAGTTPPPGATRLGLARLEIRAPAYTHQPPRSERGLEARVPEGATLRWSLRFVPDPASAMLAFHDGRKLALVRDGDDWTATRRVDAPLLYRIVLDGGPPLQPDRLHRIDVVADQPPRIRTLVPAETLTLRREGQRNWTLSFEAEDDHGLAPTAPLRVTLAQGEGESIRFEERTLVLRGSGSATRRRYAHTFDLAALGLSPGTDLVAQLSVTDNRAAGPQTTQGASHILRWPPAQAAETGGLDGVVKKALPAYFRSQRQIIIDTEALIAQRRKLDGDTFAGRSDAIGVDQRLLRLRYGQFLGEENEGAPRRPPPTAGQEPEDCAPPRTLLPTAEAVAEAEAAQRACEARAAERDQDRADAHEGEEAGEGHVHDAGEPAAPVEFGSAGDVLAEYGHTHDDAEAATLLDPETRRTLKAALDQMWQAELHLRQGAPDRALPFEYKALDYIKQVQQAGRIYLARVGSELPPIDESRRLSGEREGLAARGDPLAPAPPAPAVLADLWNALATAPRNGARRDSAIRELDEAERWLRANERRVPDALGVIAAIDSVRNEPGCRSCRELLRSRLWPVLQRPPARPEPRRQPDRRGQAYLDALQSGRAP